VLVVGIIGLVVNVIAFLLLREGAQESMNMRGAYLHVLGDLLQSLVFAAGYAPVDLFSMSLHHGPDPLVVHVTYSSLVVLLFLLPQLLVSRSAKKGVDVWSLRSETSRSFELTLHTVIEGHTDIVRDVVIVATLAIKDGDANGVACLVGYRGDEALIETLRANAEENNL
jgi:hypothetical protein